MRFLDNCMPLGMWLTVEFILDERFRKLHPLQPLPEFDGTRKENVNNGEIFFISSYFVDSK